MTTKIVGSKYGKRMYLQIVELEDGTVVNVVSRYSGPGLGADTELECSRDLAREEQDAALDAAAVHDVMSGPLVKKPERFPVVASF